VRTSLALKKLFRVIEEIAHASSYPSAIVGALAEGAIAIGLIGNKWLDIRKHLVSAGYRKSKLRELLLWHPLQNAVGRRLRLLFYGLLVFGLFGMFDLFLSQEMSAHLFGPRDRLSLLAGSAEFILLSIGVRQVAVWLENV
jgi:hypothetical protein